MPAAALSPIPASAIVLSGARPYRRGGDAGALPTRFKILEWGENVGRTTGAKITVGPATLAALSSNQAATACDIIPLDYEHQSVPKHPNYIPDPREVAGHGAVEVIEGDGVYFTAEAYTPSGLKFAPNYRDVSVVGFLDADSNLLLVHSVALTQRGDVAGMEFLAASAADLISQLQSSFANNHPIMDTNPAAAAAAPDYRAHLIAMLKLTPANDGDEVTDEQIMAALDTPAPAPEPVALAAVASVPSVAPDAITALSARQDALERRLLIQGATHAGKAIPLPDASLAEMTLTALTALLDALPAGAVPTAAGARAPELPAVRPVALSADQAAAAKALGLTDTEYLAAL